MSWDSAVVRLFAMAHNSSPSRGTERIVRLAASVDWDRIGVELEEQGYARTGKLLTADDCRKLRSVYQDDRSFRSRVIMARYGFGRGEYRYLSYPLPPLVQTLRETIYPGLASIANRWNRALGVRALFPRALDEYLTRCHRAGQSKPTPLILKYGQGDYNCLHQDLYGKFVFPLQATFLLSDAEKDFQGGEFMLVENRPRRQARGRVIALRRGEGVVFPVHHRPVRGTRGYYRATMRHGVSPIHDGERFALGIIFHDAS